MYGLKPIYDFVDLDFTKQVKNISPLASRAYVVFNRARDLFIVKDVDAHENHYIVMIVSEPDGSPRPFDERAMEILRKVYQRGPDPRRMMQELQAIDDEKEHDDAKRADEMVYTFAEMLKWLGTDVVASTAWRDRGLEHEAKVRREQIRALAQ